jgi:hypothetical protein
MKWWWAIFFWALGVMITNAYVVYDTFLKDEGVTKKNILS